MNNQDNMDEDVLNILAILQQSPTEDKAELGKMGKKKVKLAKKATPSVLSAEKKEKWLMPKPYTSFMAAVEEPVDKSIYNSKVLIREDIYEVFMSLKRLKKFKSVSSLIDFALQDYITRNKDEIKKALTTFLKT